MPGRILSPRFQSAAPHADRLGNAPDVRSSSLACGSQAHPAMRDRRPPPGRALLGDRAGRKLLDL
jgi:hypothetical protein